MSVRLMRFNVSGLRPLSSRRVQCACRPDLDGRVEAKAVQVVDQSAFGVSTGINEVNTFAPVDAAQDVEKWVSYPPVRNVPVSTATAEAKTDLAPVEEVADEADTGLGAYLMQTAPVRFYMHQLEVNPLTTKCWTSFTGFFLGDIIAQLLTEPDFTISRTLILAGYGFFIDAPAGNAFYTWMDKTIHPDSPKSAKAVGTKIAIDQLIYAPIFTCVLYIFLQSAALDFESIPSVLDAKVVPTLLANYTIWPLAHGLNFYFVPTEQRILYNNFVAVCWTTWLSFIAH